MTNPPNTPEGSPAERHIAADNTDARVAEAHWKPWPPAMHPDQWAWFWIRDRKTYKHKPFITEASCNHARKISLYYDDYRDEPIDFATAEFVEVSGPESAYGLAQRNADLAAAKASFELYKKDSVAELTRLQGELAAASAKLAAKDFEMREHKQRGDAWRIVHSAISELPEYDECAREEDSGREHALRTIETLRGKLSAAEKRIVELQSFRDECERQFQNKIQSVLDQMTRAEKAEADLVTANQRIAAEQQRAVFARGDAIKAEAENARLRTTFEKYVEWHGACLECHPDDADLSDPHQKEAAEIDAMVNAALATPAKPDETKAP
jgi:hypothetical protein